MAYWYGLSIALQLAHVIAAEFVPVVGNAAGILGVGIPLVIGVVWAKKTVPPSASAAAMGGFALGLVPALIGLLLAYSLGQVAAFLIAAGSASSGLAGVIGAVTGRRRDD